MLHAGISYRFTQAFLRCPADSVLNGLRAIDRGEPNIEVFRQEHSAYATALEQAGLQVTVLPAIPSFPDSVFIEDTALCLPETTIILRPGALSRRSEADATAAALSSFGQPIEHMGGDGLVDGGDILITDKEILVGLSERTNQAGLDTLSELLLGWGYPVKAVNTPENVLHFKSDCSLLDSETILATTRLRDADCFASYRVLTVPEGEEAAANSIRVNDSVLVPDGFPATAELLSAANYTVRLLPVSQAALLDGGLSCMSLRRANRAGS